VYDGNAVATHLLDFTNATLVGVEEGDILALNVGNVVGVFTSADASTSEKTVTISGLAFTITSGADTTIYYLTQPTVEGRITPKELTVAGITAAYKVYDGDAYTTDPEGSSLLDLTNATLVGVEEEDEGEVELVADVDEVVGIFDNPDVGDDKPVTISGLDITGAKKGNYSLTQPSTKADIKITPHSIELTVEGITAADKVYDGATEATLVGTATANLVGVVEGDDVSLNDDLAVGVFADANAGPNKKVTVSGLTLEGGTADNYSLTQPTPTAGITPKELTVEGIRARGKEYDGATKARLAGTATAILVGLVEGDDVTLNDDFAVGVFADANAGPNKKVTVSGLTLEGDAADNYSLTRPLLTAKIVTEELTVKGILARRKEYDGATEATLAGTATAILVGLVEGDDVTLNDDFAVGVFADANAGPNKKVTVSGLTLEGIDADNYSLIQLTPTAKITPKELTVEGIRASGKEYDGATEATLVGTATAILVGLVEGDDVKLAISTEVAGAFANADVGDDKTVTVSGLSITGAEKDNYTLVQPMPTARITPKELTVEGIRARWKEYDGTTGATLAGTVNATLVGVEEGDEEKVRLVVDVGVAKGAFDIPDVGENKTVTISGLDITGVKKDNYFLTQPSATSTVTAKAIKITPRALTVEGITVGDKVYDGDAYAIDPEGSSLLDLTNATLANKILNDEVELVADVDDVGGVFASANAGPLRTVTISGLDIIGAKKDNYFLTQPTLMAEIFRRELQVIGITADDKVYDGTTEATLVGTATAILVGLVEGDDVTLNDDFAVGVFADANAGTNKTVTVSGLTLEGIDANDYSFTQPTPTAKITPKELTVEGIRARGKEYDGTTEATLVGTASAILVGVVGGDDVKLAISTQVAGTFGNAEAGPNKTVTVSGLTLEGIDANDYSLTQPTPTAKITSSAKMSVKGNGVEIADGKTNPSINDFTNFGSADIDGDKVANTFTIHNSGNADLTLTGALIIVVDGDHSSDFTVTYPPERTVNAGSNAAFEVTFNPSATGTRWGTLSITNDDTDKNPYTFSIAGFGETKPAAASPSFTVNNLIASPPRVESGEEVAITVEVTNIGKLGGSYNAVLKINGVVDTIREVAISAGESVTLSFTVIRSAGSYEIDIGGQKIHFRVMPLSRLNLWWSLIGPAIVLPSVVLLLFTRRRQRNAHL
jgi:hypothetical protein